MYKNATERLITLNSSYTSCLRDQNAATEGVICQTMGYLSKLTSNLKDSNLPCLPLLTTFSTKKDDMSVVLQKGMAATFKGGCLLVKFFKKKDGYFEYMKCSLGEVVVKFKVGDTEDIQVVGNRWTKFNIWEADSDIDIMVDLNQNVSLFDLGGLYMDLSEKLQRKIDLVTKNGIKEVFRKYIERDLVSIYSK